MAEALPRVVSDANSDVILRIRHSRAKTDILGYLPQRSDSRKFFRMSAEGGNRTRTPVARPRILSHARALPYLL
jgi:hypothetical protein